VRRRSLLLLAAVGLLAGCSARRPAVAATAPPVPRNAVADDYSWFARDPDLTKGFCITWVRGLTPEQVLKRLGGQELERVGWQQLVGSGDGQRGRADRYFIGVARIGDWSLIVEDNGDLGVTDRLVGGLSLGTTVVANHHKQDGHGRFLMLRDASVELDFDPVTFPKRTGSRAEELAPTIAAAGFGAGDDPNQSMLAAFALAERLTGVAMTQELLRDHTYRLTSVPRP